MHAQATQILVDLTGAASTLSVPPSTVWLGGVLDSGLLMGSGLFCLLLIRLRNDAKNRRNRRGDHPPQHFRHISPVSHNRLI